MAIYTYVILFLVASLLITLRPLPGQGSLAVSLIRVLTPVLFVIAAGFVLGEILAGGQIHLYIEKVLQFLRDLQPLVPEALRAFLLALIRWMETAVGSAGLSTTLALALFFLWAYVFIRLGLFGIFGLVMLLFWLYGVIKGLVYRILFRRKAPPTRRFPATLPHPAGFLEPAVTWFAVLLGLGLAAIPYASGRPPLDTFLAALFWAGVWAGILEIRAWLREREAGLGGDSGQDAGPQRINPIEDLFYEYQRRHPRHILLAWNEPPRHPPGSRAFDSEAVTDPQQKGAESRFRAFNLTKDHTERLLAAWRHFRKGGDLLFAETLGRLHFILISELIHLSVERGASVLILCPEGTADEMGRAAFEYFRPRLLAKAFSAVVYGKDRIGADLCPDVLICASDRFEGLLDDRALVERLCDRLRLVAGLGVERMNLSRLRYQLLRLPKNANGTPVQLLFHVEPYSKAESSLRELVALDSPADLSLNPDISARRYLLVWEAACSNDPNFRAPYLGSYTAHVDTPLLLCWLPWDRDFRVTSLNPLGRWDEDLVERIRKYVSVHFSGDRARGMEWLKLNVSSLGYSEPENTVVVTEDVHNVAEAIHRTYSFDSKGSVLVCVAGNRYLLRDFILEHFHGQRAADAYRLPDESLLPRVPRVRGGLMDLARGLRSALSSGAGLSAHEIQGFLDAFPFKPLMAQVGIDATDSGLRNLFMETFGSDCGLAVKSTEGHVRYTCDRGDHRGLGLVALKDSSDRIIKYVPACDFGVCLSENTYVMIEGEYHRIDVLSPDQGFARLSHDGEDDTNKRFRHFFDRTYRIQDFKWTEGKSIEVTHGNLKLELHHRHGSLIRTTRGYAKAPESLRFLDKAAPEAQRKYSYHEIRPEMICELRWRNVLELRILNPMTAEGHGSEGKTAFTLCALIQDTLFSLFPGAAERVAVVSAQAKPERRLDAADSDPGNFPIVGYPKLEPKDAPDGQEAPGALMIYVIEDAEEDLGVVRSFKEDYEDILGVIYDYLIWAAQKKGGTGLYHGFGAEKLHEAFDYGSVVQVLSRMFPGRGPRRTAKRPELQVPPAPEVQGVAAQKVCDSCADPIRGPHQVVDGLLRCERCAKSAVDRETQFRTVLSDVIRKMERRYHITLPTDIQVEFKSPQEIAAERGYAFIPTDDFDPRAVGLAIRRGDERRMLLEWGAPLVSTRATLAHELTHIWQFTEFDDQVDLETAEGQARYIEIDFIRANDGERLADRLEEQAKVGQDVYSRGWRRVQGACSYSPGTVFRCFEEMLRQW